MKEKERENVPAVPNDEVGLLEAKKAESLQEADPVDIEGKRRGAGFGRKESNFGMTAFWFLLGLSVFFVAAAFSINLIRGDSRIDHKGSQATRWEDSSYYTRQNRIRTSEGPIRVNASSTQNDVTVRVNAIDFQSRYTQLDVSVINLGDEPVSLLGFQTAQLIDQHGNVYEVDFTSVDFVTVNPGSTVRDTIRFLKPVRSDVTELTLVVNNVGTLKEKWFYEFPVFLAN